MGWLKRWRLRRKLRQVVRNIENYGWTTISLETDEDPFPVHYTIGFWETLGVPEIVICGQLDDKVNGVIWDIFHALKSGEVKLAEYERWPAPAEAGKFVWREVHPSQWIPQN